MGLVFGCCDWIDISKFLEFILEFGDFCKVVG